MRALLKDDFHLNVEYYVTQRSYSNDMIGLYVNYSFAYVLIRYDTMQKRRFKVNFLCACSLKPIIFE